ncbi:MAG TPA: Maf family protein [Verrucomicrobiae bacterium]|nr:Maf family protein [Verrucomicrobiae bacterium]
MNFPEIILASASPRRSQLLGELGVKFRVVTANTEEAHNEQYTTREICQLNAGRKAAAVAALHPAEIVLGADTLVALEGRLYGKPRDLPGARRMLGELQGRTHEVVTGVCIVRLRPARRTVFAVTTEVTFHPLTAAQIDRYLAKTQPLDKAGAYGIQDHGDLIVARISGSYSNVVGLPQERMREELGHWAAEPV